jgi:hypothetical protein
MSATGIAAPVAARGTPAEARPAPPAETIAAAAIDPSVPPSSSCPQVFGDPATRASNRERRAMRLRSLLLDRAEIDLVHSADWEEPARLRRQGLTLLGTPVTPDGTRRARLLIDVPGTSCRGRYRLAVDDSLGPSGRVLAILPGLVLLEWKGQLAFLQVDGRALPSWRMTWTSPFQIQAPRVHASTTVPSGVSPRQPAWR